MLSRSNEAETNTRAVQVSKANEALHESECLIEKARALESAERWAGISRRTYRQIVDAREALGRLDKALRALDKRLTGRAAVGPNSAMTDHKFMTREVPDDRQSPLGQTMEERYLDRNAPVLGVIRLLLVPLLPIELAGSLNNLARHVARHPDIDIHSTKAWGDLPESARSAVKREVRIVARRVGGGYGKSARSASITG